MERTAMNSTNREEDFRRALESALKQIARARALWPPRSPEARLLALTTKALGIAMRAKGASDESKE
jgi:hypothetical protein